MGRIELHPKASNILYAKSYNNRPIVIKSTDAGKTWRSFSSGLPNDFSGDLILDRSDPNVLYIAGTAKTTDGGRKWIRTPCNCTVNGMALDPQNKNVLYLSASEGILESTNGGFSWRFMPLPNVYGSIPNSVAVNSFDSGVLLAGTLVGLLRSSNAGSFWKFIATGPGGARLSLWRLDTVDRDSFLRQHRWFFIEVLAVGMNGRPFQDFRRSLGFGTLRFILQIQIL